MKNLIRFFYSEKPILRWFWKDAIWPYRWSIVRINLLEGLATITELAGYGIIIAFVNALQSDTASPAWPWTLFSDLSTGQMLWYTTIIASTSFAANAFLKYEFKKAAVNTSKSYDTFCVIRLIQAIRQRGIPNTGSLAYPVKKAIIRDSRVSGAMLKNIASFPIPILKIIIGFGYMFYINVWITMIIVAMMSLSLYFLRRLGKKIIEVTKTKERLQPLSIRNIIQLLQVKEHDFIAKADLHHTSMGDDISNQYYAEYYRARVLANQNLLIIKLSIAAMTFLILFLAGNYILYNQINWSILVSFVIALQFFFRNLYSVAGIAKQISSKFDYIHHYHYILHSVLAGDSAPLFQVTDDQNISLQAEGDDEEDDDDFNDF